MTDAVAEEILAGRAAGMLLNERGRGEARDLSARLAHIPIRAVYSSPLERAVDTAQAVADVHGLQVARSESFNELQMGDWTGKKFSDLSTESKWRNFNTFRSSTRIPEGETMLEVQARVVAGLEGLRESFPGQCVAVVSHADVIRAAVAHFAGIHIDLIMRVEISAASVSVIQLADDHVIIKELNHRGQILSIG